MNIVYRCKDNGRVCSLPIRHPAVWLSALLLLGALSAALLYTGYRMGRMQEGTATEAMTQRWQLELDQQRAQLSEMRQGAREHLDALALRLGRMQAHVMRLDALGQRLTDIAGLEKGEFDFSSPPAQGGPQAGSPEASSLDIPDFLQTLDALALQLDDRGQQLDILESVMMNHNLAEEVHPAGRPVEKGWLSSNFGSRTDPFTGKKDWHEGLDFAGQEGSDVLAVASGVVTWSGKRSGYGNLVEINHGNDYVTRYGHNRENLVQVGDTVKKGQVVAHMGSTGHSTGPHVHFEVIYKGKPVDPASYVASR